MRIVCVSDCDNWCLDTSHHPHGSQVKRIIENVWHFERHKECDEMIDEISHTGITYYSYTIIYRQIFYGRAARTWISPIADAQRNGCELENGNSHTVKHIHDSRAHSSSRTSEQWIIYIHSLHVAALSLPSLSPCSLKLKTNWMMTWWINEHAEWKPPAHTC